MSGRGQKKIINLTLDRGDWVRPCPFCGGSNQELMNTHTASYWLACECGAEMHAGAVEGNRAADHYRAKRRVLKAWNTRESES